MSIINKIFGSTETGSWEDEYSDFFEKDGSGGQTSVSATSTTDFTRYFNSSNFTGEKYAGGLNAVNDLFGLDYYALRARSNELFHKNAYARGIIRRIVTNVISTSLYLESVPNESIIGVPEDSLLDWAEDVETKFHLYNSTPVICDIKGRRNSGELQRQILTEALIAGDCLVVLRQSKKYKLPQVQIISGERIKTPFQKMNNSKIIDGVEIDENGKHIAYYIEDNSNPLKYVKIDAYGKKTGRQQAKLIYGADKREDGVRGVPALGIAIQPLAEIDRYRDSAQRKAVLNSLVVAAVERGAGNKRTTKPLTGRGSVRKDSLVEVIDESGAERKISFSDMVPGINFENMAPDEKVNFFSNNGVDINFGAFEASIIAGLAWALEIPPEILLLSFNSNYSASQAALNEFEMYLEKEREKFGCQYCDFIYHDWFLSMVLLSKIEAGSYLSDIKNPLLWDKIRAWTMAEWAGQVKPTTNMLQRVKAYKEMIDAGLITRSLAAREINGKKYSRIIRTLKKENGMLVEANSAITDKAMEIKKSEAIV